MESATSVVKICVPRKVGLGERLCDIESAMSMIWAQGSLKLFKYSMILAQAEAWSGRREANTSSNRVGPSLII